MTPSLPPAHHDIAPAAPPTLAELAAKARHVRQPKTAQLDAHREELLRLRRDGDSVEVLATALRGLGVDISAEALRLWLNRQLPRKRMKRGKTPRASNTPVMLAGPDLATVMEFMQRVSRAGTIVNYPPLAVKLYNPALSGLLWRRASALRAGRVSQP